MQAMKVIPFAAPESLADLVKARYAARSDSSTHLFERAPGRPLKNFREGGRLACEKADVPGACSARSSP